MAFDQDAVRETLSFTTGELSNLQTAWLEIMRASVWDDIQIQKIGVLPRLRKRLLEVGENLRSLTNSRDWIPHPREQLKNALGTSIKIRDSITACDAMMAQIDGGSAKADTQNKWRQFVSDVYTLLSERENRWAHLLDQQLDDDED